MNAQPHLALSPDLPLVWESPELLRIGVAQPVARLEGLPAAEQRFLSALVAGIPSARLGEITHKCGLSPARRDTLLELIAAALSPAQPHPRARPAPPPSVCVAVGEGWADSGWARVLAGALGATGAACSIVHSADAASDADLLIMPERYAATHAQFAPWLSLDVPLLTLRLRDRAVLIGPVLGVPGAPCLDCCNRAEVSRDPAWPAVTAQVLGSRPPSETPAVALVIAAHAAGLLRGWGARRPAGTATGSIWQEPGCQLQFPVLLGLPQTGGEHRVVPRQPDCACVMLEALERSVAHSDPAIAAGYAGAGAAMPAAARKREGVRRARPPAAEPESLSSSRARVKAT